MILGETSESADTLSGAVCPLAPTYTHLFYYIILYFVQNCKHFKGAMLYKFSVSFCAFGCIFILCTYNVIILLIYAGL